MTGGISFVDGGFGVLGPVVCGKNPVRTMGGCSKVAIATELLLSTYKQKDLILQTVATAFYNRIVSTLGRRVQDSTD